MEQVSALGIAEILGVATSASLLAGWRLYLVVAATGLAMRAGVVRSPNISPRWMCWPIPG